MRVVHFVCLFGVVEIIIGQLEQERTPDSIRARAAKDDEALYPYWHKGHHHHKFPSTGSMDCTTASGTGIDASIPVSTNTTTVTILSTVGPVPIRNSSTSSVSSLNYFTVSNSTTVLSTPLPSSLGPFSLSSSIGPTGVGSTPIGSSSLLPKYINSTSPYSVASSAGPSLYTSSSFLYTVTGPVESTMPTPVSTLSNSTLLATSPTLNTSIGAPPTSSPSSTSYGTSFGFTLPSYYSSVNPPYTNCSSIPQSFPTNTVSTTLPYSSGAAFYTSSSVGGLSSDASGTLPGFYSSVTPLYMNSSSVMTLLSQTATTSTGTAVYISSYISSAASAGLNSSSSTFPVIPSSATAPYTNSSTAEPVTLQTSTIISSIETISVLTTDTLSSSSGITSTIFVTETVISTLNSTITIGATPNSSSVSKSHNVTTLIAPTSSILKCNADNCLRALRATQTPGRLSAAQKFCSTFTKTHDCVVPTYVPRECNSWRLSSACSCIAASTKSEPCPESEMTTTSSHHAWTSSPALHTTIYYTTTERIHTKTSSSTPYKLTGWVMPTDYFPHHPDVRRGEADQGRESRNFPRFPFIFSDDGDEEDYE